MNADIRDRLIGKALEKKSDIANGSILCHYAEQLYLAAWFRCGRQRWEERKLQDAPARVAEIIEAIREHGQDALYHTGSMPGLKSYWIYPLFAHLWLSEAILSG